VIADGRRANADRGDVLSMLLLAKDDDGVGLTDRQVRDEVMTLLLAGHETTANALTWTWYELGKYPEVLARLGPRRSGRWSAIAPSPSTICRRCRGTSR